MVIFFSLIGALAMILFLFAGGEANIGFPGGGANIGLGIICGFSFLAAAIVRLAQAVEKLSGEKLSGAEQKISKLHQPWSVPDNPAGESSAPPA